MTLEGAAAALVVLVLLIEFWLLSVAAENMLTPDQHYRELPVHHTPRLAVARWWRKRRGGP